MCEKKFLLCKHCGNIVGMIYSSGVKVHCCGEPMRELIANTEDASYEKHLPAITIESNKINVKVGSVTHPMVPEHFIEWVYLKSAKGGQRKCLAPNDPPELNFLLSEDDSLEEVYAYCNIHGLWKTVI